MTPFSSGGTSNGIPKTEIGVAFELFVCESNPVASGCVVALTPLKFCFPDFMRAVRLRTSRLLDAC